MSLVNDMLRDLDQRRKDSEGPAARIKLTPAGDYPRQGQKNWIPFVAFGLVIVAAGLGYIWMDISQRETSQRLATTVAPVNVVVTGNEEIAQEAIVSEPIAAAEAVRDTSSPAKPVLSGEEVLNQIDARANSSSASASAVPALTTIDEVAVAALANSGLSLAETSDATTPASRLPSDSIRSLEPTITTSEQIKDASAPSPEQRDTMIVQEALQMLANNQPTKAYATLEQHLLDSPYAHQSRETYAKLLMSQGDIVAAQNLIGSGLELAPNHSGFKKVKARLLIGANDISSAVSLLESRAPTVASDLEYHEILASAQLASRDYNGAVLSYTGLVQQDQAQGRWWYGFAAAQDALGNLTAARQAYTRALEKPNLSTNLRRRSQDRLTALTR